MKSKTRKTKLKTPLHLEFFTVYNSDTEDDIIMATPVKFPKGLKKDKAVKAMKSIVRTYTLMQFNEFCKEQGWGFFLEWERGNYEYL